MKVSFIARSMLLLSLGASGPLAWAEPSEMGELVVVGSRTEELTSDLPGSATAITSAEIKAQGAVDLIDVLQREPGVSIPFDFAGVDSAIPFLEGGSNSINIRGLEGSRVNLNIDGIRQPPDFNSITGGFGGLGGPGRVYFDPAVLSQVEIYKSASSVLWGSDALAGTVSARTEGPRSLLGPSLEGRTITLDSTYASKNESLNERIAAAWGDGSQAFSVVYSYRTGQELENNSDIAPNPLEFDSHALVLKGYAKNGPLTVEPTVEFFRVHSFTDLISNEEPEAAGIFNTGNDPSAFLQTQTSVANSDLKSVRQRFRASVDLTFEPENSFPLFDQLALKAYLQRSRVSSFNRQLLEIREFVNPETEAALRSINPVFFSDAFFASQESLEVRDRINDVIHETDIAGIDLQAKKEFTTGQVFHQIQYGYEFSRSTLSSTILRTDFPAEPDNRLNMAPSEVWRNGVFARYELAFGPEQRFVLTPAIRVDDYRVYPENSEDFLSRTSYPVFDIFGRRIGVEEVSAANYQNTALSPSLSLLVNLTDHWAVYGTTSRGVRNPTAEELSSVFQHGDDFLVFPNPELEEERSFSNEVGAKYNDGYFSFETAAYWNFFDDFLESNVPTGEVDSFGREILTIENRDEVEIYGFEVKASWDVSQQYLGQPGFSLGGAADWARGRQTDPDLGTAPLNTIDPWKLSAWLGYDHPSGKWGLTLLSTYFAGKEPEDIAGDFVTPTSSYLLVDLNGYVHLTKHVTLRGGIHNLLDEEYVLWSRSRRGSGHNGGALTGRDTQPGINTFVSLELVW